MPFDLAGARAAGYSDTEIASFLGGQTGFNTQGAIKAGYQPSEIVGFLSQAANKPAPEAGDPLTRVSASTPANQDSATTAITPQVDDVGGGRGKVNPPLIGETQPGQEDVGPLKSLALGAGRSFASIPKDAALAAAVPAVLWDKLKGSITGKEDTSAQDAVFSKFVDPSDQTVQWYNLSPNQKQGFLSKLADGIGGLAADLPLMIASGGLSAENEAVQAAPTIGKFAQDVVSHGFDAMRPIMVKAGVDKAQQVLDNGGSVTDAVNSAATEALYTGFSGAQPMSAEGSILRRVVTGLPVGALQSEAHRAISNATAPANMQEPFSPENLAVGAVTNAVVAGAMGHAEPGRIPAREDLGYDAAEVKPEAMQPAAPAAEPAAPDPISKIAGAQNVDQAISAAQEAVESAPKPYVPKLTPDADALSIRPLKVPDVGTSPEVPGEPVPADTGRPADAGTGVEAPVGDVRAAQPAVDTGDVRVAPEGEPVPLEPAGADEAVKPVATFADRPDGTLVVQGDPATLKPLLNDNGITSVIPRRDGVLVGRSQVEQAKAVLGDFQGPAADKLAPNPLKTFLIRNGIALHLAPDFVPGTRERLSMGRAFRQNGLEMDALAERAAEAGFIRDPSDTDELYGLIAKVAQGERVAPMYGHDADRELQAQIDRQRALEQDTASHLESVPDSVLFGLDDKNIPWDAPSNATTEDFLRSMGASDQEIRDAVADESARAQSRDQSARDAAEASASQTLGGDSARIEQARAGGRPGEEALVSPTREDILAQQARAAQGEREQTQRRAEQEARANADAQRAEFTLTGSDRAADANPNQGSLYDISRGTLDRLAFQNYEKADVPRVQAARRLSTLLDRYNNNKISDGSFQLELQILAHQMTGVSEAKQANRLASDRRRGADLVREKLINARRTGTLDEGTASFGLWMLDRNPDIANDLGASIRSQPEGERGSAGRYNPAARVITLFKDSANDGTAVHEILHHTERMMPEKVQNGIADEWAKAFDAAVKKSTPEQKEALFAMAKAMSGAQDAQKQVRQAFRDGTLKYDEHYQLVNPSEFWAVNATRIMQGRYEAGSWIGKARQYLSEMLQRAKGAFGLQSDAPVLRGLKEVLNGEGTFVSKNMLAKGVFHDIPQRAEEAPEEERGLHASPGARMLESARDAIRPVRDDILRHVAPMSTGSQKARAVAQKFANDVRAARMQWQRMSDMVKQKFTPEERQQMWDAADEQNTLMQQGKDTTGKGLDRLSDKQRSMMETLHRYGEDLWKRAQEVGMVEGEGLPFWTPRMAVMVGEDGSFSKPGGEGKKATGSGEGRNVMTTAPSAMHRKHVTTEESEAALKAKKGDNAQYVHDILTMPLAMSRFEQAIAGRELINQIKEVGLISGKDTVSNSPEPGFFTLDHPAFNSYRPRMVTDADGKTVPAKDQNGEMVFDKVPLFISKEFEGPLKAVMSKQDGVVYRGYMLLKSKAMTAIMASPLTHNMVIYGRALAYNPLKVGTGYLYWKGNTLARDNALMDQAIRHGLVPIGANKNSMMDITDVARGVGREGGWGDPDQSWVNLSMQKLGNALHEGLGDAVKGKMDAMGDFVHHTLLWKQVGAVQIGIYNDMYQHLTAKGFSDKSAGPLAAHFANRYAGAVANENMSEIARKAANVMLFSRSFNMGNLGAMKDVIGGMSAGLKAKMLEDVDALEATRALSYARRKALGSLMTEVGISVLAMSVVQSAVDRLMKDKSWDEITQGYVRRLGSMFDTIHNKPFDLRSYNPYQISPTYDNEPGKKDRIDMGEQPGGRHEYMRLPTGKVVEDMIGWALEFGDTFSKKMSPMAKAIWQDITNDRGFGVPVTDPDGGAWEHVYDMAAHVVQAQVPWETLRTVYDATQGKATPLDKDKLTGFATGFSFSQGHPQGPEGAVAQQTEDRVQASRKYVMEAVKRDLKYGYEDKARDRLESIGLTPREITRTINRIESPRSNLSNAARKKFNLHSNDAERQEMDRVGQ